MTEPSSTSPSVSTEEIMQAVDEARALRHPHRSMRVTLECAHLRLMPCIATAMGIGAQTACKICPSDDDGYAPARTVVNVEETGHLDDEWLRWRSAQNEHLRKNGEQP